MINVMSRRIRRERRGNAVLDAAFVLPILISLAFGTIEYGYFFFVKHSLQGAAREGARVGILPNATNAQVLEAVASSLHAAGLNSSPTSLDAKFTLNSSPATVEGQLPGVPIEVTIQSTWDSIGVQALPKFLGGIDAAKVVKGTTVMRKEG